MLLNVTTGKADVVIVDPVTADTFSKKNPGKIMRLFDEPVAVYGGGFSVNKGETDLLNTLNGAVDAVMNTGQSDQTLRKYDPQGALLLPVAKPYEAPVR